LLVRFSGSILILVANANLTEITLDARPKIP
jgi:hypothetical protein